MNQRMFVVSLNKLFPEEIKVLIACPSFLFVLSAAHKYNMYCVYSHIYYL